MDIGSPRRILAVGAPDSNVLQMIKALTGSAPEPSADTTAGLTQDWRLETKYYKATLSIWIDEISDLEEWHTGYMAPEAREVISVLGAWLYCFKKPMDDKELRLIKSTMSAIHETINEACGYGSDIVCLAIAMPQTTVPHLDQSAEDWEDIAVEHGFEYIDFEASGKNQFQESRGIARVQEALEACEWNSNEFVDLADDCGAGERVEGGFTAEEAERNAELFGLKGALHDSDDAGPEEEDVDDLEGIMRRMLAIREMSEGMEDAERKRFALKAVNNLMRDLKL